MMAAPTTAVRPMEHTSDSANIAYYRERGAKPGEPYVWANVLRSDIVRVSKGEYARKARPDFYVTVYRTGAGEPLAKLTYAPKSRPAAGALPARTVTRLVRDALAR